MASPKRLRLGLRGKLLLFGLLLVAATVTPGVWSTLTFVRLSRVLAHALEESERVTAATAAVGGALEREDDALLFVFTGDPSARPQLVTRRGAVDDALGRLASSLTGSSESAEAVELRRAIDTYRVAGDGVAANGRTDDRAERYQGEVNPLLRTAVAVVARIRDEHVALTSRAATFARDEAQRSISVAAAVSLSALLLSALFGLHFGRGVVWPLRALTESVEALRRGNFDQRIPVRSRDEIGRLTEGFNRMAADLAEFRRANMSEVLRAKTVLEATLAALPDAVIVVDPNGAIVATNPFAQSVLGEQGRAPAGLGTLPLGQEVIDTTRDVLRGGRPDARVDLQRAISVTVAGKPMKLLPRVVPVDGLDSGRQGAVLILNDVTDLVRLDEMRMELVAVASHQLRTPVTTLRMTLDMLREGGSGQQERERELLRTALGGVDQLTATVDEFLDLTRIEAGQLRLGCERVSIGALLAEALRDARTQCEDAGIALTSTIEPDLPLVWLDPARVGLVLTNVLSNAIKYTRHGGHIEVTAICVADGARPARVRVAATDTGRGVPEDLRERVFEKFFRVEHQSADDEGVRGSGIGLYLAREVVEAHGGSIRCEAGDGGQGTRIVFELPVAGPPEVVVSATGSV